jgi:hypothetical protein
MMNDGSSLELCRAAAANVALAGGADGRSLIAIDQAPRPPNEVADMKKTEPRASAAGQPVLQKTGATRQAELVKLVAGFSSP